MKKITSDRMQKNYVLMGDNLPVQKIQHWDHMKENYSDTILFLRVDDFYFCLDQDAGSVVQIMDCAAEIEGTRSMARFNFCQLDTYLRKIVKAGFRVALCDELEDPKNMLFT